MAWLPDCTQRLGLKAGADERAVKRAYAVRLKKIDQEQAPEEFQQLRADYEAALQWVRNRVLTGEDDVEDDAADEVSPAARPAQAVHAEEDRDGDAGDALILAEAGEARDEEVDDRAAENAGQAPAEAADQARERAREHAREQAREQWREQARDQAGARAQEQEQERAREQRRAWAREQAQGHGQDGEPRLEDAGRDDGAAPRLHPRPSTAPAEAGVARPDLIAGAVLEALVADIGRETRDKEQMRELLARHLEDPRLEALDTKEEFERAVVHLLTGGWRPGNEVLFSAARELFNWRDAQRLKRFGAPGLYLDEALREAASFNQQSSLTRTEHLDVMRRLREHSAPDGSGGLYLIAVARQLVSRYPRLAAVLTDVRHIEAWQALEPELREQWETTDWKKSPMFWMFVIVIVIFTGLWYYGGQAPADFHAKQPAADAAATQGIVADTPDASPPRINRTPPPGSQFAEAVDQLVKTAPDRQNCGRALWIATAYGVGDDADLGLDYDRYVLACVAAGHWERLGGSDRILKSARERIRRNG